MTRVFSRRSALRVIGASIAATAAGPVFLRNAAQAQTRPFTWASTGGTWGETLKRVFVDAFAESQKLQLVHSAQLESVAMSKILVSCGNAPFDVSNGPQADMDL